MNVRLSGSSCLQKKKSVVVFGDSANLSTTQDASTDLPACYVSSWTAGWASGNDYLLLEVPSPTAGVLNQTLGQPTLGNVCSEAASGRCSSCSCSFGDDLDLTLHQLQTAISVFAVSGGQWFRARDFQILLRREVLFLWTAVEALQSAWRCSFCLAVLHQALVH
jgi:hypothetical protein